MIKNKIFQYLFVLLLSTNLVSCTLFSPTSSNSINTPTALISSQRTLTICLGYEPESLYPYNANSKAAWSVLEAIYDGPIDTRNYQLVPVILEKIPSFADGDAYFQPTNVKSGDQIVDSNGSPTMLVKGTSVFPHGCTTTDCQIKWDGITPLQMDQMIVTYKLLPSLKWSDGTLLTASDSVYSFRLASDPITPVDKTYINQTASYQAINSQSVQWVSKPGVVTQQFNRYFWMPLPEHVWNKFSAKELLSQEESNRKPLGWGPYQVQDWQPGQQIELVKNPNYFRINEGLPKFDKLIFKFFNEHIGGNVKAILNGSCDLVNNTAVTTNETDMLDTLLNYYKVPDVQSQFSYGPEISYLIFNFSPIKFNSNIEPNPLHQPTMRQAIAYCIDRAAINKSLFNMFASIPLSYIPSGHPYLNENLEPYTFNPQRGMQLLDASGWKNLTQDSQTTRVAANINGIKDGAPLVFSLITTQSDQQINLAVLIQQSLANCGIEVQIKTFPISNYLSSQGPFFSGSFDMSIFSYSTGKLPPCFLFSDQSKINMDIQNNSFFFNVGRYSNTIFDQLCTQSLQPLVTEGQQRELQIKMQNIFNQDLPSLPLYAAFQIDIARKDFCPFELDVSARSDLWNIESLNYGKECQKK